MMDDVDCEISFSHLSTNPEQDSKMNQIVMTASFYGVQTIGDQSHVGPSYGLPA